MECKPEGDGPFVATRINSTSKGQINHFQLARVSALLWAVFVSAFAVAIGGKADVTFCTAHVRF